MSIIIGLSCSPAFANLTGINIISEEYHVNGWASTEGEFWSGELANGGYQWTYEGPYSIRDTYSSQWSGSVTVRDPDWNDSTSTSEITRTVDPSGASINSSQYIRVTGAASEVSTLYPGWGIGAAYSDVSITLCFRPTADFLEASLYYDTTSCGYADCSSIKVSLTDENTGTLLYEKITNDARNWYEITEAGSWEVDPAHTYCLTIDASQGASHGIWNEGYLEIGATLTCIPSPSAIMLASLGLACVPWLRRQRAL